MQRSRDTCKKSWRAQSGTKIAYIVRRNGFTGKVERVGKLSSRSRFFFFFWDLLWKESERESNGCWSKEYVGKKRGTGYSCIGEISKLLHLLFYSIGNSGSGPLIW